MTEKGNETTTNLLTKEDKKISKSEQKSYNIATKLDKVG